MGENSQIQVTEAEWEVMAALWDFEANLDEARAQAERQEPAGASAGEIIELVQVSRSDWNHRTIRTLISRLVEKEAIQVTILGKRHQYSAAVSRNECVQVAAQSFFERFFDGSAKSMLLHMVEHNELSESDIEEIRRSLTEKKRENRKQIDRKHNNPKGSE
ncbi:MAG: BlaI/MecI/CopY family transcriptional regulator [Planctomycetota bacterium]